MKDFVIKTFDNKEYTINEETAHDLTEAWKGSDKSFPIDLGGGMAISSGNIKAIEPKRETEADRLPQIDRSKLIEARGRCRGQFSIQNEINKIARAKGGKGWGKLIKDKKWRENTRIYLHDNTNRNWCDYKAGECNCEESFLSYKHRLDYQGIGGETAK